MPTRKRSRSRSRSRTRRRRSRSGTYRCPPRRFNVKRLLDTGTFCSRIRNADLMRICRKAGISCKGLQKKQMMDALIDWRSKYPREEVAIDDALTEATEKTHDLAEGLLGSLKYPGILGGY